MAPRRAGAGRLVATRLRRVPPCDPGRKVSVSLLQRSLPVPGRALPLLCLQSAAAVCLDAGATAYNEKSGTITWLSVLFQKVFAQIFPQWRKGNTEGECLPNKCSETDTPRENDSWQIPINHHDFKILKNNERQLHEVLWKKFGCVSTLVSPALEGNSKSLQVFRKMLRPGLELSVWKGDLTQHAVDAVVNAANEDLIHGGGLALALVKVGGPEIQEESRRWIARYGKVPTGNIAVTGAGRLPCKVIIHAVGPRWRAMDPQGCISILQRAITSILDYVIYANTHIETLAIPAVSSGIFQFPLDLCTQTIVETIQFHLQGNQMFGNLKEIHLVSNEDPTVASWKAASEQILGKNELGPWLSHSATHPPNTMVMNNLTLQIVQGYIELQLTDVIVIYVHGTGVGVGLLSNSILPQAGVEMKWEFEKNARLSEDSQFVGITREYELPYRYVCHVIWPSRCPEYLILRNAVRKCLEKCLELNITSISFPALGTGSITIGKEEAAAIMIDEVLTFAKDHLKKKLTVRFVILPGQLEIFKIFSTEMAKKSKMLGINNYSAPQLTREEKRENGLEARSPVINLTTCNKEEMCEAKAWIQRILTLRNQHIIKNNHILYLGKEEHDLLSLLQKTSNVSISEIITPGEAWLEIKGAQTDLIEAVLSIEHMLCKVQEEVARKKEQGLWNLLGQWTHQQSKSQDEMKEMKIMFLKYSVPLTEELQDQKKQFEKYGLRVIKVEEIKNEVLMTVFQRKKKMMEGKSHGKPVSHILFQQVPHQFCTTVCRVGFQRMYSEPCDPKYGAGIYFTMNLKTLADKVKKTSATDKLIYVFEAEVLTGFFCQGEQLSIAPPPLSSVVVDGHDSVVDNVSSPETFVIFSGIQAMPRHLWTCIQDHVSLQDYSSGPMMLSQGPWGKFTSGSPVD
nr:poly [ADP-ribose] polymerase 9 isoform X1 [Microcebus murinus]